MPMVTGHLARLQTGLDFVNTLDLWPVPHDHLDSPTAALDWLVEHDLMHREARLHLVAQYGASPASGTETLARLRRVRQAMRGVLEAAAARQAPKAADLDEINRALRTHYIYELVPAPDGVSLDLRHRRSLADQAARRRRYASRAGGKSRTGGGAMATSGGKATRQAAKAARSTGPQRSPYPSRNVAGSRPAVIMVSGVNAARGTPGNRGRSTICPMRRASAPTRTVPR